jgi:catechol 2,3-dioxygenase
MAMRGRGNAAPAKPDAGLQTDDTFSRTVKLMHAPQLSRTNTMTAATTPIIKPAIHHITLKTRRLQAMIDWYSVTVGLAVIHQFPGGAWMTNDAANHRIGFLALPGYADDANKETHTGLHHSAFEYTSFADLIESYARLSAAGIEPQMCLNHGMTTSMYYADPDKNLVELQADNFGDWAKSTDYMQTSPVFAANPIGEFFDPSRVLAAHRAGVAFASLHRGMMDGEYRPAVMPNIAPPSNSS